MHSPVPSALLLGVLPLLVHALPLDAVVEGSQNNPKNERVARFVDKFPPGTAILRGSERGWNKLTGLTAPLDSPGPVVQTDVVSGKPCANMTLLYARATTEPGNMGSQIGPLLVNELENAIKPHTLNVQGVDYTASFQGYLAGGSADGTASMAGLMYRALDHCPDTKLVLVGYSQGAQVVHNTARAVGPALMNQVNSVVLFGDPFGRSGPVQGAEDKSLVLCHQGDDICRNNGILVLPPHLTYELDVPLAAGYIAAMAGMLGEDSLNLLALKEKGVIGSIFYWGGRSAKFFFSRISHFFWQILKAFRRGKSQAERKAAWTSPTADIWDREGEEMLPPLKMIDKDDIWKYQVNPPMAPPMDFEKAGSSRAGSIARFDPPGVAGLGSRRHTWSA